MRIRPSRRGAVTLTVVAICAAGVPAFAGGHGGGVGGGGGGPGTKPYIEFKGGGGFTVTEGTANAVIQIERVPKGTDSVYFSTNGSPNGAIGAADCSNSATDYIVVTNAVVNIGSNGVGVANVPICNNFFFENQELVNLLLSQKSGSSPVGGKIVGTLTINDNDKAPVLSVDSKTGAEGTTQTFTVTASASNPLLPMSFHWSVSDGTATVAAGDFDGAQAGNGSIAPGGTTTTFDVKSLDDLVAEPGPDEYFWVNLSAPVNSSISATAGKGKYNIQDIDPAPSLSVDDQSVTEGGTLTFTVTKTGNTTVPVTFDWSTAANGSAYAGALGTDCTTPGYDYQSAGANGVSIPAASSSVTFNVNTCEDTTPESNETFTVNLSNASFASISDGTGVGTINDNDNGDFETGDLSGWTTETSGVGPVPTNSTAQANAGTHSVLLGTDGLSGDEPGDGWSYLYRQVTIPDTGTTTLSVWVLEHGDNNFIDDQQQGLIRNLAGDTTLLTVFDDGATFNANWQHKTLDLTSLHGQTVYVLFAVHQDIPGGDPTAMWVDDVQITTGA